MQPTQEVPLVCLVIEGKHKSGHQASLNAASSPEPRARTCSKMRNLQGDHPQRSGGHLLTSPAAVSNRPSTRSQTFSDMVLPNIRPIWRGEITCLPSACFSDNPCKWNNSFKVVILPREEIQNPPECPAAYGRTSQCSRCRQTRRAFTVDAF